MELGCIVFEGTLDTNGYGRVGRSGYAHRIAYEEANGPVPVDWHVDHICRNRACVNLAHLDAVPGKLNRIAVGTRADTCRRGHPKSVYQRRLPGRSAYCTECNRLACAEWKRKKRDRTD